MPTVIFEYLDARVEAPEGARVMDLADEHPRSGVPFSCRFANCGTCRVEVAEGLALCEPPTAREERVAKVFNDPPTVRLACQLRVRAGDGVVRLRVLLGR